MKRKFILTSLVTLIGCFVCWKNSNYLNNLYQDLMSRKKWRRVEIVDEQSTFEELKDYSWEYLEMLVVGFAACIISFTIGWSANTIRKGHNDFRDGDILEQCLGEHSALYRRVEELEERMEELERRDDQDCPGNVSNVVSGGGEHICTKDELILSDSEKSNNENQLVFNDSSTMTISENIITPCFSDLKSTNTHPTLGQGMTIEDKRKSKIVELELSLGKAKSRDDSAYKKMQERCDSDVRMFHNAIVNRNKTVTERNESLKYFLEHSEKRNISILNQDTVEISQEPLKEGIVLDDSEGSRSQTANCSLDSCCEECESTTTNPNVKTSSSKTNVLEAQHGELIPCSKSKTISPNQVKPEISSLCIEKEPYLVLGENNTTKEVESECDVNLKTVCDDYLELDLNILNNMSNTVNDGRRDDNSEYFELVPSQSRMTLIDGESQKPKSARLASQRDSAFKINSRGRIPQYQKLHKESKTATLNEKDTKNCMTTDSYEHNGELLIEDSSSQRNSPHRQNRPSTASGDLIHAGRGQSKKKQRY